MQNIILLFIFSFITIPFWNESYVFAEEIVPENYFNYDSMIIFSGSITPSSVSDLIQDVIYAIKFNGTNNIDIMIDSKGGDTVSAIMAYNLISSLQSSVNINTHNIGTVASAAVLVYCAGKQRSASQHSTFLIHRATSDINNNYISTDQIIAKASWLEQSIANYASIVLACTDNLISSPESIIKESYILNSQEAHKFGLVNSIKGY